LSFTQRKAAGERNLRSWRIRLRVGYILSDRGKAHFATGLSPFRSRWGCRATWSNNPRQLRQHCFWIQSADSSESYCKTHRLSAFGGRGPRWRV